MSGLQTVPTVQKSKRFEISVQKSPLRPMSAHTACSVEDETRNAEINGNRNPEWWGDFTQL